jgi:hypothetical protein
LIFRQQQILQAKKSAAVQRFLIFGTSSRAHNLFRCVKPGPNQPTRLRR